jgi:hypothetical protein
MATAAAIATLQRVIDWLLGCSVAIIAVPASAKRRRLGAVAATPS